MSERFYCTRDGVWEGYGNDSTTFQAKDVRRVWPEYNEQGQWNVIVTLWDGRKICPDYTSWDSAEDARVEATAWECLIFGGTA